VDVLSRADLAQCGINDGVVDICRQLGSPAWSNRRAVLNRVIDRACTVTDCDSAERLCAPSSAKLLTEMRRSAVLFLILFGMLWQSLALARVGSTVNVLADAAHAALHWQGENHHHHADGSYHLDDSKESVHHVVIDHLSASLAMTTPSSQNFAPLGSAAHGGLRETRVPNPTLDGLLRPPRARA